uniref:Uncharacterized protein n=1 Tax=Leptobrachium leishanense TaxID=445787 RepID=A0A8C5M3E8_9ANUR
GMNCQIQLWLLPKNTQNMFSMSGHLGAKRPYLGGAHFSFPTWNFHISSSCTHVLFGTFLKPAKVIYPHQTIYFLERLFLYFKHFPCTSSLSNFQVVTFCVIFSHTLVL